MLLQKPWMWPSAIYVALQAPLEGPLGPKEWITKIMMKEEEEDKKSINILRNNTVISSWLCLYCPVLSAQQQGATTEFRSWINRSQRIDFI